MANFTANRGHRGKIEIDWKQLEAFCMIQCSLEEIAMFFGCSQGTIEKRVREQYGISFHEFFTQKRVGGLVSLRRNLFRLSERNAAVAIFLAKNWLHMKDNLEVTGEGGQPMQHVIKVIDQETKQALDDFLK
ncbi:MAG: AraC family transcriptional regulator [Dehalococcoidia bacterium]|nr:AraC family transcriptional regulator [Dehalococcoidia bacterium]